MRFTGLLQPILLEVDTSVSSILIQYRSGFLSGLSVTLLLCTIVWVSGLILGTLLGGLSYHHREMKLLLKGFSFFLASIPILILLFWMHYPLQELLGVVILPFVTASITLSFINTIAIAQLVHDALSTFPDQYRVAGRVCGLQPKHIFFKIELPILFRQLIPQILNQQVAMLHMSLFASLISVQELFRCAQQINALIYRPVEIYSALALFFLSVCLPLTLFAEWLKQRFTRDLSER